MNGYFQLEVQSEGVFVKIYPPTEGGELSLIHIYMDKQYHIKGRIVGWKKLEYREPRYETRIEFIMEDNKVREDIIRYIFEEERKKRRNEKG